MKKLKKNEVMNVGKFEKYVGKLNVKVKDEALELDFTVEDRIQLAKIQEGRGVGERMKKLIDFCVGIVKRSYPEEPEAEIKAFLTKNLETFIEELLVACGLVTREELAKGKKGFTEGAKANAPELKRNSEGG